MDTPLPNPSTLGDIYNMNPGAFGQAQDILGQGQQAATLSQAMNQQTYDQNQIMDPLRAQALQASNDTSAATLPGIVAGSSMKARQNSNEDATNAAQLKDTLGKLSSADQQRHIQDIDEMGGIFRQQGAQVLNNPIGAAQRAKAELVNAGHGDMWNPAWDSLPPDQLANALSSQGSMIGQSSQKMMELSAGINAKKDLALSTEQERQKGRLALRDSMNASAQQIEALRQKGADGRVKLSSDQAAVRYGQLADSAESAGDAQLAAALRQRRDEAIQTSMAERAAGTEAGNTAKPDLEGLTGGAVPTMKTSPAIVTPPLGVSRSAPPPPAVAGSDDPNSATVQATKAFGEPADPGKYDYRVDPATGKWQRKLKTGPLPKAN